jgi:hypothetical protein
MRTTAITGANNHDRRRVLGNVTTATRGTKHLIIAAVALTLAGLALAPAKATTVISSDGVEGRYNRSEYSAAADGKEFLVQVRGVPFAGMTQAAFDRVLADVLNASRPSKPATRFTVGSTGGNAGSSYRLVMVFGPSDGLSFEAQCKAPDAARFEPVPAGQVKVSVAFCRDDEVLSHAIASTMAGDVNDPAFRMLFAEVLPRLFPLDNPLLNGGS